MNKLDTAIAIPCPLGGGFDDLPSEAASPEDDIVNLTSHVDYLLGHASGGQPGLPTVQQLLALPIKQSTSFLG